MLLLLSYEDDTDALMELKFKRFLMGLTSLINGG